jgi:hypothetical protein
LRGRGGGRVRPRAIRVRIVGLETEVVFTDDIQETKNHRIVEDAEIDVVGEVVTGRLGEPVIEPLLVV